MNWSEFWVSFNPTVSCCTPNAWGACNELCPRIHQRYALPAIQKAWKMQQLHSELSEILYPNGNENEEWNSDTIDHVAQAFARSTRQVSQVLR